MTSALGLGARVACVFLLLALVLWVLKRTDGLGARRRSAPVQVLGTTRLGKAATLSVVRVHDEEHVLAVTGSGVTVVSTRPAAAAEDSAARPAVDAPRDRATGGAASDARPTPPSAGEFLRAGWQVLRKQPVAATDLADDEVAAALTRACSLPTARSADFATDLAAALSAVEPGEPATGPAAETEAAPAPVPSGAPASVPAAPASVPAAPASVPGPRDGDSAARTPHRCRTEARPAHLRAPRRRATARPVEDGTL